MADMTSPQGTADTTQPGREMDVKVARRVMGWVVKPIKVIGHGGIRSDVGTVSEPYEMSDGREGVSAKALPEFSTSIADAWRVVEKMRAGGYTVDLLDERNPSQWCCEIETDQELQGHFSRADTAPHAICLAALSAIEGAD